MFFCVIEGIPKASVRWYKDDVLIGPDNANYFIHMDNVLEISSVQFSDFGRYKCRAESMKRTRASENALLTQDSDVCECGRNIIIITTINIFSRDCSQAFYKHSQSFQCIKTMPIIIVKKCSPRIFFLNSPTINNI